MESATTDTNNDTATGSGLLRLPIDILFMLPDYLHNIEDYMNVSSTCRALKSCMETAHPHTILCLAWESTRSFFRPSPHFLVCAIARNLGNWARKSDENEAELVADMPRGIHHLMDLALRKKEFGLTMQAIRELYELRFSVINPVSDIIDKCVGKQWLQTPDFWNGGVDDAYTIYAEADETLFHLAIYGELFGPDYEPFLDNSLSSRRRLRVETRLEFVKYCIPDFATECYESARGIRRPDGSYDPRREVIIHPEGPYSKDERGFSRTRTNNNLALKWLLKSSRWEPHWQQARLSAGVQEDLEGWKQDMLESIMFCQGLEGLGMIRAETDLAKYYRPKIMGWKEKIESFVEEPARTMVGIWNTHEYPDLLGDLWICSSGYAGG
ncbi:hypothetical protein F4776DRAFT_641007 [Hypoxylon sp. NC0597]|nr:hypothetical protein F4776DRAFT_641007 [Hypoxylon sp. NC0597]